MPAKKPKQSANADKRVRKLDRRSKKKTIKTAHKLPSAFSLLKASLSHVWRNKKLFGGIAIIYLLLNILLVKGLAANFQLNETRQEIESVLGGELSRLDLGTTLFGLLVGSSGAAYGDAGGTYQSLLFVIMSLAVIWALRQTRGNNNKIKIKQSFYQGMYPFVPYVLVWLVIVLQLLPALIGSGVYSVVSTNSIAVGALEQIGWALLLILSLAISVYFVSSSIFASYIVTLPNINPMQALKKARKLVKFRRALVIRKVLFLPFVIFLVMVAIFLPLVLYLTIVAELIFLVFTTVVFIVAHAYMYELYRELMQ